MATNAAGAQGKTGQKRAARDETPPILGFDSGDGGPHDAGLVALRFQNQRLVEARFGLGLTQEQAAQIANVDVRTYRRYESGEVNAAGPFAMNRASRRQIVHKLAAELGIAEEELVSDATEPRPTGPGDHVLPRAVNFVGRDALLARLRGWSQKPYADATTERIITLVGIGGAGKTSLVERALSSDDPAPFIWSLDVCSSLRH